MDLDKVSVTGISALGYHGVLPEERRDGQPFSVDVSLYFDTSAAGTSDELEETVNYAAVSELVRDEIVSEPLNLIEALAERIAQHLLDTFPIARVGVCVHKPKAPIPVPFNDVTVTITRSRHRVILALGSNLGDSAAELAGAIQALDAHPRVSVLSESPLIRSEPVGGPEQPDYLNQVIAISTTLAPLALLKVTQGVENEHHRVREERWGPRTLDIDIIDYDGVRSPDPRLTLPHPRAHERAFVLQPWAWMDPQATLEGRSVADLALSAPDRDGLQRLEEGLETKVAPGQSGS